MATDTRWKPERETNGHWIAVRYRPSVIPGRGPDRQRDGRYWKGDLLPSFHMTLEQCEKRCAELNGPQKAN
jgi:hypothetical protein